MPEKEGTTPNQPPAASQTQPATQPSAYQLPAELNGKSPAEVGEYYSRQADRYKDYDQIKERADKYAGYEGLNLSPDQIKNSQAYLTQLLSSMGSGKAAVLRDNGRRIEFVDIPGAAPQTQAQTQSWNHEWELADPSQQAERLAAHLWNDMLTPRVNEVVGQYTKAFETAQQMLDAKFGLFMDALEQWQANPTKLNIRQLLTKANDMMRTNPGDYIKSAAEALLTPAQQEAAIQEAVAAQVAEYKQKWDNDHQTPILGAPLGGSHRVQQEKPRTLQEARREMIRTANALANGRAS